MNIHPIRNKKDYKIALRELSAYFDNEPEPKTEEGDRFEILATLVEAYEAKHFPIEAPDPVEAIRFRMEQGGLTVKDLVPSIGRPNRVYEVLNRKRALFDAVFSDAQEPAASGLSREEIFSLFNLAAA